MRTVAPKWLFSKAYAEIWRLDDPEKTPLELPGFRIFPYMHMGNGHHHGDPGAEFYFDENYEIYVLRRAKFHEMPMGHWSLRWTLDSSDSLETSELTVDLFTDDEI